MRKRHGKNKVALAREQQIREKARSLSNDTHFNQTECEAILKLHGNLISEVPMDRMQFRSILFSGLEISNTFIMDRIFRVCDLDGDGVIDGEEFLRCLSVMMRGTLEEITAFCYDVYDVNGDRSLAREELFMCLDGSLRSGYGGLDKDDIEDSTKEVVEIAMKKLDVNRRNQITFEDFRLAVLKDPLMMQCCGMCLPPLNYSRAIQYLVLWDYKNLTPIYKENWTKKSQLQNTASTKDMTGENS